MQKLVKILALVASLGVTNAYAADNAVIVTPGSGVTIRSVDVGSGVQAPGHALVDAAGGQLGVSGAPLYVRVPSAAIASGAYASGSIGSGAIASGAVASGAFASGALAVGSGTDGWNVTDGAKADSACGTATGTCSSIALLKYLNTAASGANPVNVNSTVTAQTGLTPGVTQTGTIVAANVDLSSVLGTAVAVNSGTLSAGVQRNVLATNSPAIPTWGHGATAATVPAGATYMGINTGGNLVGWTGAVTVASGGVASGGFAAGSNVDFLTTVGTKAAGTAATSSQLTGSVYNTTAPAPTNGQQAALQGDAAANLKITPQATATGGATPYKLIAAATNNSTLISTGAHTVYSYQTSSVSVSTPYWLKFYDKASAPTCGTDVPVKVILIPPANSGNNGTVPVGFSVTLGLGICVVGGIADSDNTSAAATTIAINVDYK